MAQSQHINIYRHIKFYITANLLISQFCLLQRRFSVLIELLAIYNASIFTITHLLSSFLHCYMKLQESPYIFVHTFACTYRSLYNMLHCNTHVLIQVSMYIFQHYYALPQQSIHFLTVPHVIRAVYKFYTLLHVIGGVPIFSYIEICNNRSLCTFSHITACSYTSLSSLSYIIACNYRLYIHTV